MRSGPALCFTAGLSILARSTPAVAQGEETPLEAPAAEAHAEIAFDILQADSVDSSVGAGSPTSGAAREAGLRVRLDASALDRRLKLDVDYRDREPVGGSFEDSALRLLYQGELRYAITPETLSLGVGRFIAPSVAFLPVDGVHLEARVGDFTLAPFGGRRAITTSLVNVDLGRFLPTAGLSARYQASGLDAEVAGVYSRDIALFEDRPTGSSDTHASSAYARAIARPIEELMIGGTVAFTQRASYVIGPTWSAFALQVHALDFLSATGFADYRPIKEIRLGYDIDLQRIAVFREGLQAAAAPFMPTLQDPRFFDQRVRAAWHPHDIAWIRADARLRFRPDRREQRYSGAVDIDHLLQRGICVRSWAAYEVVAFDPTDPKPNLDRFLWSFSAAYRAEGLDLELGASFIERRAGPISSRIFDHAQPSGPATPVDLSPFVLEAQRIAFLRMFYADESWFAGIDAEQNLDDAHERRIFAQVGLLFDGAW
jgi:hypothetical protein